MIFPAIWVYINLSKADNPHLIKSSFSFFNVAVFGIPLVTACLVDGLEAEDRQMLALIPLFPWRQMCRFKSHF